MTNRGAIARLKEAVNYYDTECPEDKVSKFAWERMQELTEVYRLAIAALEKQEKYEAQWHDDMGNPLEPIKITSALNSEIMKLEYRKEHKPKDISILDYTVIAALMECLKKRAEDAE